MSSLAFVVFMTRAEVIREYRIPSHLQEALFTDMPVAATRDGEHLYHEHQVDCFFQERYRYKQVEMPYQKVQGARPRGGRKVTTAHEAEYALFLKSEGWGMILRSPSAA